MNVQELRQILKRAKKNGVKRLVLHRKGITELPAEIGLLTELTHLDLGCNRLKALPPEIGKLTKLTYLDLTLNQLKTLSPEIGRLVNLRELNIEETNLNRLPSEIGKLRNLTHLNLCNNHLKVLPAEIWKLKNLRELNLGANKLTLLSTKIGKLNKLTHLNPWGNPLKTLPPEIWKLTNLRELSLSSTKLTRLSPEIGLLKKLTHLNLGYNPLKDLPAELWRLTNLRVLNLMGTKLTLLPPEIGKLKNLTKLNLEEKKLTRLPPELWKLTNLQELNLGENKLTQLPPEIGLLTNLTHLGIGFNQLKALPPEIGKLRKLTRLGLGNNQLKIFPPEIWKLVNLRKLNLESNKLTQLPFEIGKLTKLTDLSLGNNLLKVFPEAITMLKNLTNLSIWNNPIQSIPAAIGNLKRLESLIIAYCGLTVLPVEIRELVNLKYLRLQGNLIRTIPREISKLKKLMLLILDGNGIETLPVEIGDLKKLINLSLADNRLTALPVGVFRLKFLKTLDLAKNAIKTLPAQVTDLKLEIACVKYFFNRDGGINLYKNPLADPPVEIVRQGRAAVLNYFKAVRGSAKAVRLFEAKVLIVGRGNVGKTFLLNRLIKDQVPPTVTTEGIDIHEWHIRTPKVKDFRANFWDFGGQEIYHATHQFFLTKRSLYLLVWEARKDDDLQTFDYWLNAVKLLSDSAPLLLVMNKSDERIKPIDEAELKKHFPNIQGFYKVSAKTGDGIPDLKKAILTQLDRLPHIGDRLPGEWLEVRKELEGFTKENEKGKDKAKENYIEYERYVGICKKCGLGKAPADYLARYYHDLGVFLNFETPPILKNIVFLKPDWATDAVYRLLDTRQVQENRGHFTVGQVGTIWKEYPTAIHPHLLELMKKFELVFELPGNQGYIVPGLLPVERPKIAWGKRDNLRFEYKYRFMPSGILTRFIARTYEMHQGRKYWRNGVVLEREGTEALVVGEPMDRKIRIHIRGRDKAGLLAIIRNHFEGIHESLNSPVREERLSCICEKCRKHEEPHYHAYTDILNAQESRVMELQCRKSFLMVPVTGLLGEYGFMHKVKCGVRRRGGDGAGDTYNYGDQINNYGQAGVLGKGGRAEGNAFERGGEGE